MSGLADHFEMPADPIDLAALLEEVRAFIESYVKVPGGEELCATVLWIAHSWALDAAHATPYLVVTSPEKRSGKTRLLEVLELVVRKPWRVASASESAMFRKIAQDRPTLLLDEVDAIFGSRAERTEPLRGVLNAGNRPGASVARCVGEGSKQAVVDFSVYCPKVLAGIDTGSLPDTITDRAVPIRMERKKRTEAIRPFRHRAASAEAAPLRDALDRWARESVDALRDAEPSLPEALNDRAAEAWEPLLAIADAAGDEWPKRARSAAGKLSGGAEQSSLGSRVLAKVRQPFATAERVPTGELCSLLNEDEELPFGGWRDGRGIDGRGLAKLLRPYGVRPDKWRSGEETIRGYYRGEFVEAWDRYLDATDATRGDDSPHARPVLPPQPPQAPQSPQPHRNAGFSVADSGETPATERNGNATVAIVAGVAAVATGGKEPSEGPAEDGTEWERLLAEADRFQRDHADIAGEE